MRRLIDFYRLQIDVMRKWRPSTGSRLRRFIVTLIVSVLSFGVAVWLTPGVDLVPGAGILSTALLAAIVLGILNIAIRPVFIAAFAGISVFRWDINIRESTVLGLVGAGGIGLPLNSAITTLAWTQVSLILLIIIAIVLLLIFGGAKLPKLARSLGSAKSEFEKGSKEGTKEAKRAAARRGELRPSHIWHDIKQHARLRFPTGAEALKYNVLQKGAYLGVLLVLLPLIILTGLAMSPGADAATHVSALFGGRQSARSVHFIVAAGFAVFIVVHLVMVLLAGPFNEVRSMITGWYRLPREKGERA